MPPMARPPHPDTFAGAPSSWAALSTQGEAPGDGAPPAQPGQLPLFEADPAAPAHAPPRARQARLRGRLQALLARSAAVAPGPPASEPDPSWPDSFFDLEP